MRLLGIILLVAGFALFIGNFTGLASTLPGIGILVVILGGTAIAYADRIDWLWSGDEVDDWK